MPAGEPEEEEEEERREERREEEESDNVFKSVRTVWIVSLWSQAAEEFLITEESENCFTIIKTKCFQVNKIVTIKSSILHFCISEVVLCLFVFFSSFFVFWFFYKTNEQKLQTEGLDHWSLTGAKGSRGPLSLCPLGPVQWSWTLNVFVPVVSVQLFWKHWLQSLCDTLGTRWAVCRATNVPLTCVGSCVGWSTLGHTAD